MLICTFSTLAYFLMSISFLPFSSNSTVLTASRAMPQAKSAQRLITLVLMALLIILSMTSRLLTSTGVLQTSKEGGIKFKRKTDRWTLATCLTAGHKGTLDTSVRHNANMLENNLSAKSSLRRNLLLHDIFSLSYHTLFISSRTIEPLSLVMSVPPMTTLKVMPLL